MGNINIDINKSLFHKELGLFLSSIRDHKELSLDQVAEGSGSGLSKSALWQVEKGEQQLYFWQLFQLSKFLDFKIQDCFDAVNTKLVAAEYPDVK